MTIPQGSTVFNTQYFTNLTNSVNSAGSCSELQALVNEAFVSINALESGINAQISALAPMLALLTPPSANLGAIVTYLTSFIDNFLTPALKPTINLPTQLTELTAEIASLTAAINTASAKFPSCSITIP